MAYTVMDMEVQVLWNKKSRHKTRTGDEVEQSALDSESTTRAVRVTKLKVYYSATHSNIGTFFYGRFILEYGIGQAEGTQRDER